MPVASTLLSMIENDAPEPMVVYAADMLARVGHGGHWRHFTLVARHLLQHWQGCALWYARAGWWKLRYPGRTIADVAQERFDAWADEVERECSEAGYQPEAK